jgi:hypothetical protein
MKEISNDDKFLMLEALGILIENLENDGEEEDQNFLQELIELYERLENG